MLLCGSWKTLNTYLWTSKKHHPIDHLNNMYRNQYNGLVTKTTNLLFLLLTHVRQMTYFRNLRGGLSICKFSLVYKQCLGLGSVHIPSSFHAPNGHNIETNTISSFRPTKRCVYGTGTLTEKGDSCKSSEWRSAHNLFKALSTD